MSEIGGYRVVAPLCYQGKADCIDPRCRRMLYREEPRIRPGCMGYHCSYCDEPCGMMGHGCDAAETLIAEAERAESGS